MSKPRWKEKLRWALSNRVRTTAVTFHELHDYGYMYKGRWIRIGIGGPLYRVHHVDQRSDVLHVY